MGWYLFGLGCGIAIGGLGVWLLMVVVDWEAWRQDRDRLKRIRELASDSRSAVDKHLLLGVLEGNGRSRWPWRKF